jgi:hypothetical protein
VWPTARLGRGHNRALLAEIVGIALYQGRFELEDALALTRPRSAG